MVAALAAIGGELGGLTAARAPDAGVQFFCGVPGAGDAGDTWDVPELAERTRRDRRIRATWLKARFHAAYPGLYHGGAAGWQTTDGTIPYRLYLALLVEMDALDAAAELRGMNATLLAIGLAFAQKGKDAKVKAAVRTLTNRAIPEVDS